MKFLYRKSAFFTALLIAVVAGLITGLILHYFKISHSLFFGFITTIILFVTSMLTVNLIVDRFYNRQIRSIYKNILQLRTPGSNIISKQTPNEKVLSEINSILIEWEKGRNEEIDHLKELETYRKEFLGNVSHELKTPIFTIQGYIHTLIDGGIEDMDINMLYLQKAAKSLDRLISIVDDLESISKLEAGELIVEKRTFEITDLVREVLESLELRAQESNIRLTFGEGVEKPGYVYADKDRIRQVLINLVVNSVKYGRKGGHTKVMVKDEDEYFAVEVRDDGIGIDKSHLNRLFERFYRIDKSRSREQGGTGLGLAIVKHIIEAHGEKITVDSEFGKGTAFTFTLIKSK